jgi:DNA polymerase IV
MSTERIIIHIDMNSFFASVEQQANPFLRGKPLAITGKDQKRSVVTTASIEAKRVGVKTAMSTWEAKRICPSLILYPGDPHKYSNVMERFNAIYRDFTPQVEIFSVDESFLDVTEEAQDYFGATCIAQAIRERLREELGEHITASIGIAPNKLMAKLVGESVKPNGLTVARPQDVMRLLDQSDLEDLCGIGPRVRTRLNNLGIETFKQLREFPLKELEAEFNRYGIWLHEAAHGRDMNIIISPTKKGVRGVSKIEPKSYGHSYTLAYDTYDVLSVKRCLLGLSDKVAWRMRRDGYSAMRVSTSIRFGDFTHATEQRTFQEPTADGLKLFYMAWNMIKYLIPTSNTHDQPIRLVGLSASKLIPDHRQFSLFKKEQNVHSVLPALDILQHRYGAGVWTRASLIKTPFKKRSSGFHFDHLV